MRQRAVPAARAILTAKAAAVEGEERTRGAEAGVEAAHREREEKNAVAAAKMSTEVGAEAQVGPALILREIVPSRWINCVGHRTEKSKTHWNECERLQIISHTR